MSDAAITILCLVILVGGGLGGIWVLSLLWQGDKIKAIRCRRCRYEGPPRYEYVPGSVSDVWCPDCGSGNWVSVEEREQVVVERIRPRKRRRRRDDQDRRRRRRDEENDE